MRRTILALALAASILPAAPAGFDPLWRLLAGLWSEAGCILDPDGHCGTAQGDEGCILDPDGRCGTVQGDEGCWIDPNGRCAG